MSFQFEWPEFSDEFQQHARQLVENALNKGNKPPIIADRIEVVEIEMGSQPPELEIRDIGEITMDQFRGIFRLSYNGDAYIVLRTKVQANPLTHKKPDIHLMAGSRGILAAHQPLVVPMLLRLSRFKINCYVVLVVSKQKGITLVFKTDPLQNVDVNSTFDSIAVLQKYIQREIEEQLREMFREDLPSIIHRLSQTWLAAKTKVQAPYLGKKAQRLETMSTPDLRSPPLPPTFQRTSLPPPSISPSLPPSTPSSLQYHIHRATSVSSTSLRSSPEQTSSAVTTPATDDSVFPNIENYDPTYGMRPEGVPVRSHFTGFKRLWAPTRGLADLTEEASDDIIDGSVDAFDLVSWDDVVTSPQTLNSPSLAPEPDLADEYEAIPAVGGGVVMRPRIVHAQSRQSDIPLSSMQSPIYSRPSVLSRSLGDLSQSGLSSLALRLAEVEANPARQTLPRAASVVSSGAPSMRPPYRRDMTVAMPPRVRRSSAGAESGYFPAMPTPPPSEVVVSDREDESLSQPQSPLFSSRRLQGTSSRRRSLSPLTASGRAIVLRPGLNESVSQLGTLSQLNQTLSPYTRTLEHVTVRSVPRSTLLVNAEKTSKTPQRARRKRVYHIGRKAAPPEVPEIDPAILRERSMSPVPPSDFDASDRDHYFRQDVPLLRRRTPYRP